MKNDVKCMEKCKYLEDFLKEQCLIMKRHINKHKYYIKTNNATEAMQDFITKYAWVMREMYCDTACPIRNKCEAYQNYLKNDKEIEKQD